MSADLATWAPLGAAAEGLPEPPADLAPGVTDLGDGRWGTRPGTVALSSLDRFAGELLDDGRTGYVLAGVEEAARRNAPAIHYLVASGSFGLFAQVLLDDPERPEHLARLRRAQDLSLQLDARDGFDPGCLAVVEAAFTGSWWRWTGDEDALGMDGLRGALRWLEARIEL